MPPVVPVSRTRFPATSKGALAQATYEHHPRDAHGWSLGSELLTQPSPGDRTHARHHCIQAPHGPARGHRLRRGLSAGQGGGDRDASWPEVVLPGVRLHHLSLIHISEPTRPY